MVPQTQVTEIRGELEYAVAHQCGPTYTGPSSGFYFVNGLLDAPVPGYQLLQNSMPIITHFWEVRPGHELAWVAGAWVYRPVWIESQPAKNVEAPKPDPKVEDKPKRRRGRPKGSKNKRGAE